MPEQSALIIGNGAIGDFEKRFPGDQTFDVIVAADGGLYHAQALGLTVNHLIGDFDSTNLSTLILSQNTKIHHKPSQEQNDLEKALLLCIDLGLKDLTLIGFFGKRTDHTLNNLSVLCRYDTRLKLTILEPCSQVFLVRKLWKNKGKLKRTISLIPLGCVEGVKTEGLVFPLHQETLEIGRREGLSNYASKEEVVVTITKGVLAVFVLYDGL